MVDAGRKRGLIVSSGWVQAALLVILFGFSILGWLAYQASTEAPSIPARVVDPAGTVIFSGDDITSGQVIFLHNGLMEYGSIFGHGGYADYLRRSALAVQDQYGGATSDQARAKTIEDLRTNRYDPTTGTLQFSAAQAQAFASARAYYQGTFSQPSTRYGLRPCAISDPA